MIKRRERLKIYLILILFLVLGCNKSEKENNNIKIDNKAVNTSPGEEDLQKNNEFPPVYPATYEELVSTTGGKIKRYSYHMMSDDKKQEERWDLEIKNELKKLKPLSEEASDEEIEQLFRQFLQLVEIKYEPLEEFDKFSYLIFKNDMIDPSNGKKIEENTQLNIEIVLDASGSMSKKINDRIMMDIAKESIVKMMNTMPKTANVGLRVYGHKGNNTAEGKNISCDANELVQPIEKVNKGKFETVIQNIQPTGWTPLASSMEKGISDLKQMQGDKNLNVLYIITDGIETCGGNPEAVAERLKKENAEKNMDVVLGIIGFNVETGQSRILQKIALAANGKYAVAENADKLLYELQQIHEMAYSEYKWQTFDKKMLERLRIDHDWLLRHNGYIITDAVRETVMLQKIIYNWGYKLWDKDSLFKENGTVYKRLEGLRKERLEKIEALYKNRLAGLEKKSKDYLSAIETRTGETAHFVKTRSHVYTESDYYIPDEKRKQ